MSDNDIVFQDRPSWRSYLGVAIIGVICTTLVVYGLIWWLPGLTAHYPRVHSRIYPTVYILPLIIILFFLVSIIYQRYSHLYIITSNEVISRHGIIARNTNHVPLNRITDMNVRQNPVERLLHIGSVYIDTAGGPGMEAVLWGVESPFVVQEIITGQTNQKQTGVAGNGT